MKLKQDDYQYLLNEKIKELAKKLRKPTTFIVKLLENGTSLEEIEKNAKTYKEMIPEPMSMNEVVKDRMKNRELESIAPSTGYKDLDNKIMGFIPGRVYLLAAETNVGKTALAVNFAVNVIRQQKKVLYLALEPGSFIADYIASVYFDIQYKDIEQKHLEAIAKLPIKIYTEEINSIEMLEKVFETVGHYDLVIIDHIGYFISTTRNVVQAQSNLMKQIASFAKTQKSAVLLIAHLNKPKDKSKKININRISGSAAFKQDATDVFLISREETSDYQYSDKGELTVAKTKAGGTGPIEIFFEKGKAIVKDKYGYGF